MRQAKFFLRVCQVFFVCFFFLFFFFFRGSHKSDKGNLALLTGSYGNSFIVVATVFFFINLFSMFSAYFFFTTKMNEERV